ncbi:SDR family oxidoreductase [Kribbella capetownensis]|uniref:SDR family oxidoreductase n=1 Tax=Kribbella capetownensis TaxID=1572659 RepID=A0A4R0JTL7_9ACTN|nr:SDR family oxidoreductase [Kribbella capetownensis]TCC50771.1 SDR family oxidoreductase [Kribbella capetownensis]
MNLGIRGRRALVSGASEGLGRAIALALAREGVDLTIVARRPDVLERTAMALRTETGVSVTAVPADISTAEGRAEALAATPHLDILVNNSGGGPMGDFRDFTHDEFVDVVQAVMLSPIEMMRATLDAMIAQRFGRIINITTMGMRVPNAIHQLCNTARGGLTAFVSTIANEHSQHNVTINNLLPGPFATDRMKVTSAFLAKQTGRPVEDEYERRVAEHPARRFGRPEELGATCAFLCSTHAGYITGQNILVDGGLAKTTF